MVLRRTGRSAGWALGDRRDTIGVRVPNHAIQTLLARTGPLAVSSANPSGQPPLADAGSLRRAFGHRVAVYLVIPVGDRQMAPPSTVVDLTEGAPRVLREGSIRVESVEASAGLHRMPE